MTEHTKVQRSESRLVLEDPPHPDGRGKQIAEYGIQADGRPIGWLALQYEKRNNAMSIASIVIDADKQGKGYGKEAHRNIALLCQDESFTFVSGNNLTDGGREVWESFVRDGQAVREQDGYKMLPFEDK